MKHKKAFTLIELLVVIAIIAILAAILFPVFAQAKAAAKKATSISNMKQIGLGGKMYENDYDDMITQSQYCTVNSTTADDAYLVTWQDAIYPYIKAGNHTLDATLGSGNGSAMRNKASGIYSDPGAPDNQSFPYGIHRNLAPDNWGPTCFSNGGAIAASNSATVVPSPSDTIMFMTKGRTENGTTANDGWGWIYFICDEYGWVSTLNLDSSGNPTTDGNDLEQLNGDCDGTSGGQVWAGCGMLPRYRYAHTSPMAFVDGHSKSMSKGSVKFVKNIDVRGLSTDSGLW